MEARRKAMLFREVNERIAELLERSWPTAPGDFLCECGRDGCSRRATLSLPAYRGVRLGGAAVLARECARPGVLRGDAHAGGASSAPGPTTRPTPLPERARGRLSLVAPRP